MKKFLMILMTLVVFLAPQVMRAQSELTVHDGTATNGFVPVYGYYSDAYLKAEMVYPAAELAEMNGATISGMTFYASQSSVDWGTDFQVFLVEVADATISAFNGPGTVVYEGALTISDNQMSVEFTTPYTYGGGNLLVGIYQTNTGSYITSTWYGETVTGASVQGYSYNSLDAVGATQRNFLPKTTFTYQGSGPVCEKPSTFDVTDITGFDAICTWTSEVGNYTFEYKKASASDWTVVTGLTANTYTLSNLEPYTIYNTRVKAVCGTDLESGYKTANFTTLDVCPDGMVCIGEGTATNSYLPTYNFYNYSLTQQIYTVDELGDPAAILGVDIYSVGTVTRNLEIYMVATEKDTFADGNDWIAATTNDLVFSGEVTFAANSWNTMEFDNPFVYNGQSNVALIVRDMTGSYVSGINFLVFDATGQAIRAYRDGSEYDIAAPGVTGTVLNVKNRVRFAMGEPPACPKPTGVTVNYTGGITAEVSWLSDATSFNIDVNGTVTNGVTNPYTLTGLDLSTDYAVMVQADCGTEMSEWTNAVEFTTDDCMPEDMIIVNYELADSYGDGWNGNYILVVDENCDIVDALTIESGSTATGTVKVCGTVAQFMWYMSGSNTYPSETSWSFTDANGNELFAGAGNSSMATYDVLYTIDLNPYAMPTDLEAVEVGPYTATLGWTENGTATAWQIGFYDGNDSLVDIIDANSNPFTLTGLDPETGYYVRVRATGANGTSLWPCLGVDFTTLEACAAPATLDVTPYPTSAVVNWTAFEEAYDIAWAVPAEYTPSANALWLQYDDGTYATSIGSSSGGTWTWGVMYPADSLQGNTYLNKIGIYEVATYYDMDNYTVHIYTGGTDAPGTLVGTQDVVPTGATGLHEIMLPDPIAIDPQQNLWITVTAEGTYVLSSCQTTESNDTWVLDDDTWAHIGDLSSSLDGYGWMIRGFVDNVAPSVTWTTTENITPPYTIEGLEAESDYLVRVKASCGTVWGAAVPFTTPSACDAPVNLTAEAAATSAELNWVGYQDSYNMKYWIPAHVNDFNEEDFTQVGEDYMADSVLTTYTINLPGTGVGNVAIRHYNITDMFRLNVDDITVTDPNGTVIYSEDFEDGVIPDNMVIIDNDGDGNNWYIWNITQQDANGNDVGNGSYCATSASYNSVALTPDNWLIITNVELGGTLTFVARGQDPSWSDEIFGVYVSTVPLLVPASDAVVVEGVANPYQLTGLDPETTYAYQVQGVNASCDGGLTAWSEIATFTTEELPSQVIALNEGTTWVSFNKEITLSNLKAALVAAAPGATIKISGQNNNTSYNPRTNRWSGTLTWDLSKMYKIYVETACEVTLVGMPIDPADHPVTIVNGNNYLGFPFDQNMTLENAFAGFAVNGDKIYSQTGSATYNRGRWQGSTLTELQPGKGYLYKSAASGSRTFVFPVSAR